jgi:hypothetical protein
MTNLAIHARVMRGDTAEPLGRLHRGLRRASELKRNPRSRDYMEVLAREVGCGEWTLADDNDQLTDAMIRDASRIVLLWPDATGLGSASLEDRVARVKSAATPVFVLNGRRRYFELTPEMRRRFRRRRFMQRFWIGEAAFFAAAVAIGLPLAAWDLIRGRS